ncbi:MAG: aldehyde dehydrogenase family protein [Alphaproteobacteria bacterium]|nr:aldehyde dehydrogenase family protein [Alphaproteobacteria bacterium]
MTDIICISPIDGREVARRPSASQSEIERVLKDARAAQKIWRDVPLAERMAKLTAFVDAMMTMNQDAVPELAIQMGRPVKWGGEFRGFEERARHMIKIAPESLAPHVPQKKDGFTRFIEKAPAGVVFVIAPWNYPYLTAVNSIVPALVAGNAVILKHAAQTLLVGERFAKAMEAAQLPKGLFTNIVLTHDDTAKILSSHAVDHCVFTGSVAGGRAIERAAAGTFTTLGLELGGKDPAYVRADANFDHAVENLVDGVFFNSGQSCCGIERIYVHESLYDRFVDGFVALTKTYKMGNPLDESVTLGPLATAKGADVVRTQIKEALAKGAKAHIDASLFPLDKNEGPYLMPQVLTNVDHSMALMREENFGPVVGIMKIKDDAEAVRLMNDSPYGLTAAIWTQDEAAAQRLGRDIETGTVFMNRCDYLDPALAWTGVKDTGRGVSLSAIGYDMVTRAKSYHLRSL